MTKAVQVVDSVGAIINPAIADGMFPGSPIHAVQTNTSRPSGTWAQVITYTVTAGKTLYITGLNLSNSTAAAIGVEFLWYIKIGTTAIILGRVPPSGELSMVLGTPIAVAAGVAANLWIQQWSGGNLLFSGTISGYEV